MNEFFDFSSRALLNPPPSSYGTTWTQLVNTEGRMDRATAEELG